MHKRFDHKEIEPKWQKKWRESQLYKAKENTGKPKAYILDMFPYPSGEGLHVGHPKGYIATDIYSRYKRMTGHKVLHPMGWDAFGLPAENYAIKNKVHPRSAVEKNIRHFKEQLEVLGFDYDWEREINTTDPEYYKWTQWIFIQLFKKGLAYESNEPINWCPSCQTGLANEDLEADGTCERCGSIVERRPMRQWVLKIREYADRMLEDLTELDWPEHIKELQRNWIGRSEGAEIDFALSVGEKVTVFTTRPDTLFGATYVVLAPEHTLIEKHKGSITNWPEVEAYVTEAKNKKEMDRLDATKEKTGVRLEGITAINPANNQHIPVYVADYVLASYGTGAIMAVPAHDERDFAFAKKFNLTILQVIDSSDPLPFSGDGLLINSAEFNNYPNTTAKEAITKKVGGRLTKTYKLRDWVFSRQRYWGEPIPVVHCAHCGVVPVPEDQLPVTLPEVEHYEPTGDGRSPLANITDWVNTICPNCGGPAERETNTMPQWAGSSWYYLRYMDPKNSTALVSPTCERYWAPVDVYVGGAEHATRHLIYARFWHKFLYDIGVVSTTEPFMNLHSVGLVMAEDGRKMSKRWGNVINPDDVVAQVGADTLRIYEMFMGPFENAIAWSKDGVVGARRFLERVYGLTEHISDKQPEKVTKLLHKTIKKVSTDIESFKFNTAISTLMIFLNTVEKEGLDKQTYLDFLRLLAPFAPHLTEELWEAFGSSSSIHQAEFPTYNPDLAKDEAITIGVQINGKARGQITVAPDATEEMAMAAVNENQQLRARLSSVTIKKVVYVPGRILNLVVID